MIDPACPTPLYLQIAETIRSRIASGELAPGDVLAPLREAAEQCGVNLHTVRHAYTALAREGLVEMRRGGRGTRVASRPRALVAFVDRVLVEAAAHGLSRADLIDALGRVGDRSDRRPTVFVVECSRWQCEALAAQIAAAFDVDAQPWPLDVEGDPPAGATVIATYFHYNDVRRRWPQRLRDVRFVTIAPRPDVIEACVDLGARCLVVIETDEPTARNVAADVSVLPGAERWAIRTSVVTDPERAVEGLRVGEVALLPPRVWARVGPATRARKRAVEVAYLLDAAELAATGEALRWPSR